MIYRSVALTDRRTHAWMCVHTQQIGRPPECADGRPTARQPASARQAGLPAADSHAGRSRGRPASHPAGWNNDLFSIQEPGAKRKLPA